MGLLLLYFRLYNLFKSTNFVHPGNKKDLSDMREVKEQEGVELAAKWGTQYFESSALFNDNVTPIFKVWETILSFIQTTFPFYAKSGALKL